MRAVYSVVSNVSGQPLVIRDVGHKTGCTVTNDAEAVVEHVFNRGLIPNSRQLIYLDSNNESAELMHNGKVFTGFRAATLP